MVRWLHALLTLLHSRHGEEAWCALAQAPEAGPDALEWLSKPAP